MDTGATQGALFGQYQDTENYPFAIYDFNCDGVGGGVYAPYENSYYDVAGIPSELINNGNWFWTWTIMMIYIASGGWLVGYVLFIPASIIMGIYNAVVSIYAFFIMLFENPNRLNFQEWVSYPFRRQVVQALCILFADIVILIPGVSAFAMPALGALAISDFLDYQGWAQVGATLSIPFSGTEAYGYTVQPAGYTPIY